MQTNSQPKTLQLGHPHFLLQEFGCVRICQDLSGFVRTTTSRRPKNHCQHLSLNFFWKGRSSQPFSAEQCLERKAEKTLLWETNGVENSPPDLIPKTQLIPSILNCLTKTSGVENCPNQNLTGPTRNFIGL